MFAAVLKGIGGASIIQESAQWSYVADTASPRWRSIFFSLIFLVKKLRIIVWLIPMQTFINVTGPYTRFLIGFACWILYAVAAATLLQRDFPSLRARYDPPALSFSEVARSIMDPIRPIFRNQTLFLLTALFAVAAFAQNACALEWQLFAFALRRLRTGVPGPVRF